MSGGSDNRNVTCHVVWFMSRSDNLSRRQCYMSDSVDDWSEKVYMRAAHIKFYTVDGKKLALGTPLGEAQFLEWLLNVLKRGFHAGRRGEQ